MEDKTKNFKDLEKTEVMYIRTDINETNKLAFRYSLFTNDYSL